VVIFLATEHRYLLGSSILQCKLNLLWICIVPIRTNLTSTVLRYDVFQKETSYYLPPNMSNACFYSPVASITAYWLVLTVSTHEVSKYICKAFYIWNVTRHWNLQPHTCVFSNLRNSRVTVQSLGNEVVDCSTNVDQQHWMIDRPDLCGFLEHCR